MARSQNGYSANDRSVITTYTVTKAGRKMALRKGPAGEMLADFIRWFDENIRDIDPGILDDWGYAERPIRGSTTVLSNHASGTAADVDATKWPLGVRPEAYLTAAEIARVRAKLKEYRGCIRWGGDYDGRKDPMHWEIDEDEATVAAVWAAIQADRGGHPVTTATAPTLEELTDMTCILRHREGASKGRAYFVIDGVAAPINDDGDMAELRDKEKVPVFDLSDGLIASLLAGLRP